MGWPQVARRNLFQCIVDATSISQERQRVVSILILLKVHIDIGVCVKICVLLMYVHNKQSLTVKNATSGVRFWTTVWPKQPEGTEYRALHLRSTEKTFKTKRNGASARIKICVLVRWQPKNKINPQPFFDKDTFPFLRITAWLLKREYVMSDCNE